MLLLRYDIKYFNYLKKLIIILFLKKKSEVLQLVYEPPSNVKNNSNYAHGNHASRIFIYNIKIKNNLHKLIMKTTKLNCFAYYTYFINVRTHNLFLLKYI